MNKSKQYLLSPLCLNSPFYRNIDKMPLAEVESFAIDIWKDWQDERSVVNEERLETCLIYRNSLLNKQFRLTKQEFERFRFVANLLIEKTEMLFRNSRKIYRQLYEQMKNGEGGDFSDFCVEASISVPYNGTDSVWDIEDYAGSDYYKFAEILDDFYSDKRSLCCMTNRLDYREDIEPDDKYFAQRFGCYYDENLEIETDWHDWLGNLFPMLKKIPVCYALHELFDHTHYSLQDIIRINDVWSEVKVVWQNIYSEEKCIK